MNDFICLVNRESSVFVTVVWLGCGNTGCHTVSHCPQSLSPFSHTHFVSSLHCMALSFCPSVQKMLSNSPTCFSPLPSQIQPLPPALQKSLSCLCFFYLRDPHWLTPWQSAPPHGVTHYTMMTYLINTHYMIHHTLHRTLHYKMPFPSPASHFPNQPGSIFTSSFPPTVGQIMMLPSEAQIYLALYYCVCKK